MKEILLLLILAYTVITGYVIGIAGKHKARKSISDSDYWLTYPWKWIFEVVLLFCSIVLITVSAYLDSKCMLLGAFFIGLVAVFSRFKKDEFMKWSHIISATLGFSLLTLSFWVSFGMWYLTIGVAVVSLSALALTWNNDCKTWNFEIALLFSIFFSVAYAILTFGLV